MAVTAGTAFVFGSFRLDSAEKVLYRDGSPVALTPKAFDTLAVLVDCHPRLVTKDELMARVWPGTFVEDNNLAQHVSLLRRTLACGAGTDTVIETVPKRGYRFRPAVERIALPGDRSGPSAPAEPPDAPTLGAGPDVRASVSIRWRRLGLAAAAALLIGTAAGAVWVQQRQGDAAPATAEPLTRDADAHLAYLGGRAAFAQGYSDTRNQARARADVERAVARDPGFAEAWALLARIYGAQYRTAMDRDPAVLDAAERAARTAVAVDPRLPSGHLALADVFFSRRDHQRAKAALVAGRDVLAQESAYWHLLAQMAQREGRWADALADYQRAFDLDAPATAEWMTVHFLHLRQYEDARRVLAVAQASNRSTVVVPDAWTRFSGQADLTAARQVLETALGARPSPDARVLGLLAQFEWFDGRAERALELVGRMDAAGAWLAPNFRFPAAIVAGDVLHGAGRVVEARREYANAVAGLELRRQADPDDPKIAAALALAHAGLGQPAEAVAYGRRAVALLSRDRDATEGPLYLYLLARVHARLGQVVDAARVLDEMFEAPGFYSEAWVVRDPSFAALRADAGYASRLERWAARKGPVLLAAATGRSRGSTSASAAGAIQ